MGWLSKLFGNNDEETKEVKEQTESQPAETATEDTQAQEETTEEKSV